MNVNYIFVFTICVVIPNVLSKNITTQEEDDKVYCDNLAHAWNTMNKMYCPIGLDKNGNIILKIKISTGSTTRGVFIPSVYRIGIYLTSSMKNEFADEELIVYLASIFNIPKQAVNMSSGLITASMKTMVVTGGFIDKDSLMKKLFENLTGRRFRVEF